MSCYVIAEAGVNHDGEISKALKLADAARQAGADAVKFQTFRAAELATAAAEKAAYQKERDPESATQREMLQRLELSEEAHLQLRDHCARIGIDFLSSPFGVPDLQFLVGIGVTALKIGSGEITNVFLLEAAARSGLPVYLSTGMCSLGEVAEAMNVLGDARNRVTLLHCVSAYPAPSSEVNLKAMQTMRVAFGVPVGYSDHTEGTAASIAAVALGAPVIEKHLTLDRSAAGPDHAVSLEPDDFARLVADIREVESTLGDGVKRLTRAESDTRLVARKSLVAARDLKAGHVLAAGDLIAKRPGTHLSPMRLTSVLGRRLSRDVAADSPIGWEHL